MADTTEIAIVMGTEKDMLVMQEAAQVLDQFGVAYRIEILFTHQDPERFARFALKARETGLKVIIAGASGAAHLPGMIAAYTPVPVIGVPIKSNNSIDGLDAIYSILQMPAGVPVATMALDSAKNAAIFALQILSISHQSYFQLVDAYKRKMREDAERMSTNLATAGYERFLANLKLNQGI